MSLHTAGVDGLPRGLLVGLLCVATGLLAGCAGGRAIHGAETAAPASPAATPSAAASALRTRLAPPTHPLRPGHTPPTAATAAAVPTTVPAPRPPPARGGQPPVTTIGDSVMLGAAPNLRADIRGVVVDAVQDRQFDAGVAEARLLAAQGRLGSVVVVQLGTNGPFDAAQFDQMMQVLAPASHVLWLTVHEPRYWEGAVNQVVTAGVARWSSKAALLDWHAIGAAHPEYFYSDGIHLEPAGAAAYAKDVAGGV